MANHTILGGKVNIYKRGRSQYWQCSTYLAGKNRRISTKQESLALAKEFAEDWYLDLRGKNNRGELKAEKTFKQATEQFLREYEVITEGQRNPGYVEGHERRLRLHLIPFFGDKGLSEITPGLVQEYRIYRLNPDNKPFAKPFKQAVRQFEKEYGFRSNHRSEHEAALRLEMVKQHMIPYFDDIIASAITPKTIEKYKKHRFLEMGHLTTTAAQNIIDRELGSLGEMLRWMKQRSMAPSKSTMHHEIVTLRQVVKTAIRHGWLAHLPDFSPPYRKAEKVSHRAWFAQEEYRTLYEASRERTQRNKGTARQWASKQLHDYILFMANTGLRPDEANSLEFRDVEIVEDEPTGETILLISVRGKRGVGYCKSMANAVRPFERLRDRERLVSDEKIEDEDTDNQTRPKRRWRKPKPTDLIFPANHKKQFNAILEENGLKFDREGNRRTAYSLRHTYICFRLLEGADIYQIAKNCRTSVEMIEKYYASHIATTLDASAINVRRPQKSKSQG